MKDGMEMATYVADTESNQGKDSMSYGELVTHTSTIAQELETLSEISDPHDILKQVSDMCENTAYVAHRPENEVVDQAEIERALETLSHVAAAANHIEKLIVDELQEYIPGLSVDHLHNSQSLMDVHERLGPVIRQNSELKSRINGIRMIIDDIHSLRLPSRLPLRISSLHQALARLESPHNAVS